MSITYTFLGDSITCADRFFVSDHAGLGDGFVYLLSQSELFQADAVFFNKGFDGLTAASLLERLEDGRITFPFSDVLCLLIGINDIGVAHNTGKELSEYLLSDTLSHLIELLSSHTGKLVIFSPFLFPYPEEYLTWMEDLSRLIQIFQDFCLKNGILFYDLQKYFQKMLKQFSVTELSSDGIHLTRKGHHLLANYIQNILT